MHVFVHGQKKWNGLCTSSSLELLLEPSEGVSREGLCHALGGRGQRGGLQLRVPTPDHLTQGIVHRKNV